MGIWTLAPPFPSNAVGKLEEDSAGVAIERALMRNLYTDVNVPWSDN